MLIKRIISAALVLGVMAAFAVAGSPLFAAGKKSLEVSVYGNYNTTAPTQDKVIPGPGPIQGIGDGAGQAPSVRPPAAS